MIGTPSLARRTTGATHSYFSHPEWEANAPGLKTIDDALEIRRRVLLAFEAAERETDRSLTIGKGSASRVVNFKSCGRAVDIDPL